MKIGTYEIDLRSAAIGALAAWIACSMFEKSDNGVFSPDGKSSSGHWYDFGNGMVNLDRVNLITTTVSYGSRALKITDEGCEEAIEHFEKESSRKLSEDERRQRFLSKIRAQIEFDDFTLNLECYDVENKSDIRKAFRSWKQTLAEIKKAQR